MVTLQFDNALKVIKPLIKFNAQIIPHFGKSNRIFVLLRFCLNNLSNILTFTRARDEKSINISLIALWFGCANKSRRFILSFCVESMTAQYIGIKVLTNCTHQGHSMAI